MPGKTGFSSLFILMILDTRPSMAVYVYKPNYWRQEDSKFEASPYKMSKNLLSQK
jgi:hypothetical protein